MSRFTRIALATVLGLGLIVAALSVVSATIGATVDSLATAQTLDGTSVNTQIAVTFTQPMNHRSVERSFSIVPHLAGDFTWSGNQLLYLPRKPLTYSTTYTVTIAARARDAGGRHLFRAFRRSFTTQSQHLVYLGTRGGERGHLVLASASGTRQIIDPGNGGITDFSVSFDRSLIVYVQRGGTGQRPNELWILSLSDDSAQRLYRHADWTISQPRLSPDGKTLAFLAGNVLFCSKSEGCQRSKGFTIPYLFDLHTRKLRQFRVANQVQVVDHIAFSPTGQLAFTLLSGGSDVSLADVAGRHQLDIPVKNTAVQFAGINPAGDTLAFVGQLPLGSQENGIVLYYKGKFTRISGSTYTTGTPAFSPSGRSLTYSGYRGESGTNFIYGIDMYELKTKKTAHVPVAAGWSDWQPILSPDERYIAYVQERPNEDMYMGTGQVWIVRQDGSHPRLLDAGGTNIQWVT